MQPGGQGWQFCRSQKKPSLQLVKAEESWALMSTQRLYRPSLIIKLIKTRDHVWVYTYSAMSQWWSKYVWFLTLNWLFRTVKCRSKCLTAAPDQKENQTFKSIQIFNQTKQLLQYLRVCDDSIRIVADLLSVTPLIQCTWTDGTVGQEVM